MKSAVIETKNKVFIKNIPQLIFGRNTDNSFIRYLQLSLSALGESYSYDYLKLIN